MNVVDKAKTENLAAGGKFHLENVPVKKFYDQAQYVWNTLLPEIEKKRGKASADYTFFSEVYRSLLYAIMVIDREKNLVMKIQHIGQLNHVLSVRLGFCERELLKYSTMEDLYLTEAHEHIQRGVIDRARDLLNDPPVSKL